MPEEQTPCEQMVPSGNGPLTKHWFIKQIPLTVQSLTKHEAPNPRPLQVLAGVVVKVIVVVVVIKEQILFDVVVGAAV